MVGSNFTRKEERTLISRFIQREYDQTRSLADKKRIVLGIQGELAASGRRHTELAIVKKWSDLKRRNMDRISKIRDWRCPGAPLPSVRRRREAEEEVKLKEEEEDEENDGEVAGPSHQSPQTASPTEMWDNIKVEAEEEPCSLPPAPEKEVPHCPRQEVMSELSNEISQLQRETTAEIQYMKKRMEEFERKQKKRLQKLMDLQKRLTELP
ncbi:uncharacterized protein LOC130267515 [Hyla sarda]|uniref:uncharacterized protein LOC130267515 n=1 Tax=Hyla sarda TaxID=327740 RepID=UPI0024C29812|nr:uncharacterized protein LOC130267515 [Hyla sarda]